MSHKFVYIPFYLKLNYSALSSPFGTRHSLSKGKFFLVQASGENTPPNCWVAVDKPHLQLDYKSLNSAIKARQTSTEWKFYEQSTMSWDNRQICNISGLTGCNRICKRFIIFNLFKPCNRNSGGLNVSLELWMNIWGISRKQ